MSKSRPAGFFGLRQIPWKSFGFACAIGALAAAGIFGEVSQALRSRPNHLEVYAAPRGNAASLLVSWRDAGNHVESLRVAAEHVEPAQRWKVEIRSLEQKNSNSLGYEVWLLGAAAPDPVPWQQLPVSDRWQLLYHTLGTGGQALVASNGSSAAWQAEITGGTLLLRFRRCDRGGMAEISANGILQTVDLYSAKPDVVTLAWQPDLPVNLIGGARWLSTSIPGNPNGEGIRIAADPPASLILRSVLLNHEPVEEVSTGWYRLRGTTWPALLSATLAALAGFLLLSGTLILAAMAWRDTPNASALQLMTLALVASVTVSAFWTAVFFPGIMSPDSINQWQQAVSGQYTNWHPIGMTLVMRGVHLLFAPWSAQAQIGLVAWIQGILFWFGIFSLLNLATLPARHKIVLCALMTLYYPVWLYTVTLWKDVWLAAVLFGLLWWAKGFLVDGVWTSRTAMAMVGFVTFAMMQRHTASLSFAVLVGLSGLGYFARLSPRRSIGVLLWLTVVLSAAVSAEALIYRACRVVDIGNVVNGYCSYEIAGMVHFSNRPMTEWQGLKTYQAVGRERFEQAARGYVCGESMEYLIFPPGHPFELDDLLRHRYAIQDMPVMVLHHPLAYLEHKACLVGYLSGLAGSEIRYPSHERIEENSFGIEEWSLLPRVKRMVFLLEHRALRLPILQLPFRHWLLFLGSALAALTMSRGKGSAANRKVVRYLCAAGFAVLFPLLLATPSQDWRYLMPANLCWICSVLIALASLPYFEGARARTGRL